MAKARPTSVNPSSQLLQAIREDLDPEDENTEWKRLKSGTRAAWIKLFKKKRGLASKYMPRKCGRVDWTCQRGPLFVFANAVASGGARVARARAVTAATPPPAVPDPCAARREEFARMAAQDLRARLEAAVKLPAADGSDVLDPLRAAAGDIFPDLLQRLQDDDVVSITRAVLLTDARTKIKNDQIIEAFKSIKRRRFAKVVECVAFEASFANGGRKVGTPEVNRGVNAKLLLSSRSNLSSGTKEAGATKLAACRTIQSEAAGYVLENGGHFSANAAPPSGPGHERARAVNLGPPWAER